MRRLLILLMLLTPTLALELTKTVTGPELVGLNETLDVSLVVMADGEYVERIEEDIPEHFVAVGVPSSCRQSEDLLVCNFGQVIDGKLSINYHLKSIGTGYGIIGTPRLYYDGGLKTIDFFQQYFVGKPRVELSLDGESTLLPGEDITILISLENPGTRVISDAFMLINYGTENLTKRFSLSPGEIISEEYLLGEAKEKGHMDIHATVTWGGSSVSDSLTTVFVSPSVQVTRDMNVKWRATNGDLNSYVEVTFVLRNNGTAPGNATFRTGGSHLIGPGESKSIVKEYPETAPAEKVSIRDAQGRSYGVFSFEQETPEVEKGFFVLIYQHVASEFSPLVLFGVLLGAVYFASKFKNSTIKAGFLLIAMVSGLLLYSHYAVGVLDLPGFGPKLSTDSAFQHLPENLSGLRP